MQQPSERPMLTTPSVTPKITPTSRRFTPSASSINDDDKTFTNRPSPDFRLSTDTLKTSRSPYIGKRAVASKRPNGTPVPQADNDSDEDNRDAATSYFDPMAAPTQAQFLSERGRPLSFYDMKEQQKQARQNAPPMTNRYSWRSSDMPYNYADIIGDNRYSYAPPSMGRPPQHPMTTNARSAAYPTPAIPSRLPWTMWMNSEVKNMFVAAIGEWVGTTMFLFFAFAGTQVANAQSNTPAESTTTNATAGFSPIVMLYISVAFGFSLMVNVWIFFRISGGLFNPAVTLALWATGAIKATRAICLFIAQIVGSITASGLVLALFPTRFNVRTTLSDGTSLAQGVFIEAFMTAELVFTILMLAKEKHKSTFIAPVGIGLALFVAELVGVYYTGGSLNPARSLGPCIVTNEYDTEHWIYWVGPAIGSLLAIGFYKFIKMLEYEMANPGQDGDDINDPTKNPNHEVREKQRVMTAKVLESLGYPGLADRQHQASREPMSQAEEGTYYGSRATSVMDDEPERRRPSGLALSTVASMSDIHSPIRPGFSSPEATSSSSRMASTN